MIATIEVNGLRIRACHGVMVQERIMGNEFEISIKLRYPIENAMASDELDDTLNYVRVVEIVQREMAETSQLLEHVAGRIYRALIEEFPYILGGEICLSKLTPPIAARLRSVGVKIEW